MNKTIESKKKRIAQLRSDLMITRVFATVMSLAFCTLGIIFMNTYNDQQDEISKLEKDYKNLKTDYNILTDRYDSFNNSIEELLCISETLDEQNKSLVDSNQEYYDQLQEYKNRAELYDKYDYALFNDAGERTDITYGQLKTLEELIADSSINDEDLILSLIMTESNGNETAKNKDSSAKGYGQIINSTSKFVYTRLLGKSGWTSNIALDGATNMEMTVAYVDYLYRKNDKDLYKTIKNYRGKDDVTSYISKMDSYLSLKNKSVEQLHVASKE